MILVTGASGFIGSHLAETLLDKENKIRVLVKSKQDIGNLAELSQDKLSRIEILEGDLTDKSQMDNLLKGVSCVFHLAAIARPMNVPNETYFKVNVDGTRNLLSSCKKNGIKKFVLISSMSVFGYSRDRRPLNESSPKLPVSAYGESKLIQENLVVEFCKINDIFLVVVRPPMVFGPRDLQFLKLFRIIDTGFMPLLRKGKAKMEFTYVKNLVKGIILAYERGEKFEDYNLNDGRTYSIREVFSEIANSLDKRLFPVEPPVSLVIFLGKVTEIFAKIVGIHPPFNSGTALWMINDNEMDISKAREKLGYKTTFPQDKSIKDTINYYRLRGYL